MPLVPLAEAQGRVLAACRALAPERVDLAGALGLVAAEEIRSGEAVPPFDNSAMDGYALRAADTAGASVGLTLVGEVAAGSPALLEVGPGQAVRIMTGAPLPPGADAVAMVEITREEPGGEVVEIRDPVTPGTAVRRAGEDLRPGDRVISAGQVLGPGRLGVLASLGAREVLVVPRARVGVLSTGDELVEGPGPLRPGQIRDANRPTLLGLVRQAGCEPVDLGIVADDEAALAAALERGVAACDALVTSGGVSMGSYDKVRVVLDRLGDMAWMQVAIKPAKPFAFGVVRGVPVFGLPGNPVSSMVSFELLARPGLRQMMGHRRLHRPSIPAVATDGLSRRPDGKTHFARVVVGGRAGGWEVRSAGGQGSHQLAAMAAADGLAVLPDGDGVPPGGRVNVVLLRSLEEP